MFTEGASFTSVLLGNRFSQAEGRRPGKPIPTIKTDLKALDIGRDTVAWLGHSSYFIQLGGRRLLIDPIFSSYAAPVPCSKALAAAAPAGAARQHLRGREGSGPGGVWHAIGLGRCMSLSSATAVRIFGAFASALFLSFILRTINASISWDLAVDLSLSNAQLGSLSGAYFVGFLAMQLPLGVMLDRYGARRTQAWLLLLCALGCFGFAAAKTYSLLWLCRGLMGVGSAAALMAALKGFRFWYAADRQPQLAAAMLIVGTSGAIFATLPVRAAVDLFGWRPLFAGAGVVLLLVSLALLLLVPRDEDEESARRHAARAPAGTLASELRVYRSIFTDGYFWRFGLVALLTHGGIAAMQALWAGPWLREVQGLGPDRVAAILLYFNLAMMLGYALQSWAVRHTALGRAPMPRLVAVGVMLAMAIEALLALVVSEYAWLLWLPLAVTMTLFTLVLTHISQSFDTAMTGRVYVAFNVLIFGGNWLVQSGFGSAVDLFMQLGGATSATAFRATMLCWVALQLIGLCAVLASSARPAFSAPVATAGRS